MSDVLKTQRSFARKAKANPEHRFEDMYHLLYRTEWITTALDNVLSNDGAKTPGVDGVKKANLKTVEEQFEFINQLRESLRNGEFTPTPVKRVWIPKPGKKEKRGLGIPTMADRVVQEMLRMLLEPIWESDFLDCSNGFRPGRRTMDCIAVFWAHATSLQKYYWVLEGDIRKCFDRINHVTLMKLVAKRIADPRILTLIEKFLKAGLLEEGIFHETEAGTPQGGVLSPLLANIYLNELDQWWWRKYGSKTHNEKRKNRNKGRTNAILTRYADDFCILCNGYKEEVEALREELKKFLWDELHLELSEEKTRVTHMDDGLDFLGYHIQRYTPNDNRPWVRITPSRESVHRFAEKLKKLTRYNTTFMPVTEKLRMLNRLIKGWGNYYRHVNFSTDAAKLDWWINERVLIWLMRKHKGLGVRAVLDMYKVREKFGKYDRWNFGTKDGEGKMIYVSKLTDIRLGRYRLKARSNPYLCEELTEPATATLLETPFSQSVQANFSPEKTAWLELRQAVVERDNFRCVRCGSDVPPFHVHHITARKDEGKDEMENLETLCNQCHIQTESYGRNKRDEKFEGKLDEGKLSCPV